MILWTPSETRKKNSQLTRFTDFLAQKFNNYSDLHQWSVKNPSDFWQSLVKFEQVIYEGDLNPAFENLNFIPYSWFPKVKLNLAENLLRFKDLKKTAILFHHESGLQKKISYSELFEEVC